MITTTINLTTNRYVGRGTPITLIGIHTMEAPEAGNTAENVANYFKTVQASAHWCVDDNSRVRVVNDEDSAWTMPPANHYSLNVEMAGYAAQTPQQWADAYSDETLDNAALCVAEWCVKHDIPVRHLTDSQIGAHEKGIAGHVDVNRVFHGSTHTDPGPNFPWSKFLNMVHAHISGGNVPAPPPGSSSTVVGDCTPFQDAIHVTPDGVWGPNTQNFAVAVIDADFHEFPSGVKLAQEAAGTVADGNWGPKSATALKATIVKMQEALTHMGYDTKGIDGAWGPNSNAAFDAASAHFYPR